MYKRNVAIAILILSLIAALDTFFWKKPLQKHCTDGNNKQELSSLVSLEEEQEAMQEKQKVMQKKIEEKRMSVWEKTMRRRGLETETLSEAGLRDNQVNLIS